MPKGPHLRHTFHGVYGSVAAPLERWQFSLNQDLDPGEFATYEFSTADKAAKHTALAGLWTGIRGVFHPQIILTHLDTRAIGSDGHQPKNAQGTYRNTWQTTLNSPGTASTGPRYSPGTALAVSLNTPRSGPTGKGRFFLPAPNFALDIDYRIQESDANVLESAIVTSIKALNDQAGGSIFEGKVSVMSSKGFASPVTSIAVGRVLDQMSSRRRSMLEGKVVTAVPA